MKVPSDVIREEIARKEIISFARFMELALYCPETGYYEREKDIVGRRGDFITSVSVGSLFGELLAFQFAVWLGELTDQNEPLKIVEAGAHDGKLAADILGWLQCHRPELFPKVKYCILEPSDHRRQWQQETLKRFDNVQWLSGQMADITMQITGILFGNELLDAFPVRRLGWNAQTKTWFEWGVTFQGGELVWARMLDACSASDLPPGIQELPPELLEVLPDGYIIEDSPSAANWWRQAAAMLQRGKLLAIDYGFTAEEMISPARTKGTLRAYHRHQVTDDLLADPGEQDLTAHVNFSAIQAAGEKAGLKTELFCQQPQFLTRILQQALPSGCFGEWNPRYTRQFQTLTHPEHLGRAFRVLVQLR